MPVSDQTNITPIMLEVARCRPKSILDLGIGFGKYGVLCREMLDIEPYNLSQESWQTNIIGVEGFEKYRNPCWQLYSSVMVHDFTQNYESYKGFDLVLMIDSLEHVEKGVGSKILDTLLMNNKRVIVSCPTGKCYVEQGAVHGNEFERHRAHWTPDDFDIRAGKVLHNGVCIVSSLKGYREI
jgi:hypothetical protein